MTQLDDLQAFTNLELPRRSALLTVTITGYDGDPNNPSAPAIIQLSPNGTWYFRESPTEQFYRKFTSGWIRADAPFRTEETLTFPIDYNDGTAVDPPSDTTWTTQQEIDDYLTSQSATNFQHVQLAYDTLPTLIDHDVTFNLATGIHRPSGSGQRIMDFDNRILNTGDIVVNGAASSTWPVFGGFSAVSISSIQAGSKDPYFTFPGSTFPNDGSLKGKFVRTSTGQVIVIHDHTDAQVRVCRNITGSPTTIDIVTPGTILRNSLDDVAIVNSSPMTTGSPTGSKINNQGEIELNDLHIQSWGSTNLFALQGGRHRWTRVLFDALTNGGTTGFGQFLCTGAEAVTSQDCSTIHNPASFFSGPLSIQESTGPHSFTACYWTGAPDGVAIFSGSPTLTFDSVVLDDMAKTSGIGALRLNRGNITILSFAGVQTEIRDTVRGVTVESGSAELNYGNAVIGTIQFTSCTGPCVWLARGGRYNSLGALLDGGGNTDVGIELVGPQSSFTLPSSTTVTGSVGDVRMADGSIVSHSDIASFGPFTDIAANVAKET